jgi:flavodoxin
MKVAIVYYSLTGNVGHVVERLAPKLRADVFVIRPKKAYPASGPLKYFKGGFAALFSILPRIEPMDYDKDAYDVTVLATPIWAGRPSAPMLSFVAEENLSQKDVSLVMCSRSAKARGCMRKLSGYVPTVKEMPGLNLTEPTDGDTNEMDRQIDEFPKGLTEGYKRVKLARQQARDKRASKRRK